MSKKKPNSAESVRDQWTQQRMGGAMSAGGSAAQGSHFAKPASPAAVPAGQPGMQQAPVVRTALQTSSVPQVNEQQGQSQASVRKPKIAGISGEMPAVPVRPKHSPAMGYSRYNKRYLVQTEQSGKSIFGSITTNPIDGMPAYSWLPFAIYGAVGIVVSIFWCLISKLTSQEPLVGGDAALTVGLVILCLIVLGGFVLVAVVSAQTLKGRDDISTVDVVASSMGKASLMMLAGSLAWVGAAAVATL